MVKIGSVQLSEREAENLYKEEKFIVTYGKIYQVCYSPNAKEEKFIVTYGKIYQVCYSPNAGFYGLCVYTTPTKGMGLVKRGRYITTNRAHVERLMYF